jgi:toxin ParE1/3/4
MSEHRFKVVWSEAATFDLVRLASWAATDSPTDATALLSRLRRRADSLATAPTRGRIVPELAFFGISTLREVVERPYRIVYRLTGRTVEVLGLFDARRELEDVLLERLTAPPER